MREITFFSLCSVSTVQSKKRKGSTLSTPTNPKEAKLKRRVSWGDHLGRKLSKKKKKLKILTFVVFIELPFSNKEPPSSVKKETHVKKALRGKKNQFWFLK